MSQKTQRYSLENGNFSAVTEGMQEDPGALTPNSNDADQIDTRNNIADVANTDPVVLASQLSFAWNDEFDDVSAIVSASFASSFSDTSFSVESFDNSSANPAFQPPDQVNTQCSTTTSPGMVHVPTMTSLDRNIPTEGTLRAPLEGIMSDMSPDADESRENGPSSAENRTSTSTTTQIDDIPANLRTPTRASSLRLSNYTPSRKNSAPWWLATQKSKHAYHNHREARDNSSNASLTADNERMGVSSESDTEEEDSPRPQTPPRTQTEGVTNTSGQASKTPVSSEDFAVSCNSASPTLSPARKDPIAPRSLMKSPAVATAASRSAIRPPLASHRDTPPISKRVLKFPSPPDHESTAHSPPHMPSSPTSSHPSSPPKPLASSSPASPPAPRSPSTLSPPRFWLMPQPTFAPDSSLQPPLPLSHTHNSTFSPSSRFLALNRPQALERSPTPLFMPNNPYAKTAPHSARSEALQRDREEAGERTQRASDNRGTMEKFGSNTFEEPHFPPDAFSSNSELSGPQSNANQSLSKGTRESTLTWQSPNPLPNDASRQHPDGTSPWLAANAAEQYQGTTQSQALIVHGTRGAGNINVQHFSRRQSQDTHRGDMSGASFHYSSGGDDSHHASAPTPSPTHTPMKPPPYVCPVASPQAQSQQYSADYPSPPPSAPHSPQQPSTPSIHALASQVSTTREVVTAPQGPLVQLHGQQQPQSAQSMQTRPLQSQSSESTGVTPIQPKFLDALRFQYHTALNLERHARGLFHASRVALHGYTGIFTLVRELRSALHETKHELYDIHERVRDMAGQHAHDVTRLGNILRRVMMEKEKEKKTLLTVLNKMWSRQQRLLNNLKKERGERTAATGTRGYTHPFEDFFLIIDYFQRPVSFSRTLASHSIAAVAASPHGRAGQCTPARPDGDEARVQCAALRPDLYARNVHD